LRAFHHVTALLPKMLVTEAANQRHNDPKKLIATVWMAQCLVVTFSNLTACFRMLKESPSHRKGTAFGLWTVLREKKRRLYFGFKQ
jgi:hypothetical protein